jgi:hypothetical protein
MIFKDVYNMLVLKSTYIIYKYNECVLIIYWIHGYVYFVFIETADLIN